MRHMRLTSHHDDTLNQERNFDKSYQWPELDNTGARHHQACSNIIMSQGAAAEWTYAA